MSGLHAAIIMDGNGRWARRQGKPRWRGHLAGVDSVRDVVRGSPDLGITTLTLYAFSSDNWKRPAAEGGRLFWLLREYCRREHDELIANGVRVSHIGRRDRLPAKALAVLDAIARATAAGTRLHLRLAIDYSAQGLIAEAARRLAEDVAAGIRRVEDVSRDALDLALTDGVPPVDLLMSAARASSGSRTSCSGRPSYAELFFTPVLWPGFRRGNPADDRRQQPSPGHEPRGYLYLRPDSSGRAGTFGMHHRIRSSLSLPERLQAGRRDRAQEIGLRIHASRGSMSLGQSQGGLPPDSVVDSEESILKDSQRLIQQYHDPKPGAFVQIVLAPCSPLSVTGDLMKQSATMAREYGGHLHTHLAETEDEEQFCLQRFGHRPLGYMQEVDWVGNDVWFAHAVWVNDEEIKTFAKH